MLTRPNYEKLLHLLSSNLPQNLSLLYFKVQPTFCQCQNFMIIEPSTEVP
nr:hypothetical protein [Lactococcus fujiensis]